MKTYPNFPPEQRRVQRLVDQFNAEERIWQRLEPSRRTRRKARPTLSGRQHKALDLLEFAQARPPQDCIGEEMQP